MSCIGCCFDASELKIMGFDTKQNRDDAHNTDDTSEDASRSLRRHGGVINSDTWTDGYYDSDGDADGAHGEVSQIDMRTWISRKRDNLRAFNSGIMSARPHLSDREVSSEVCPMLRRYLAVVGKYARQAHSVMSTVSAHGTVTSTMIQDYMLLNDLLREYTISMARVVDKAPAIKVMVGRSRTPYVDKDAVMDAMLSGRVLLVPGSSDEEAEEAEDEHGDTASFDPHDHDVDYGYESYVDE